MSVFEYLGVLVSVIVGLGITHVLAGFSKMIHRRDTLKVYWVHVFWSINLLIQIVAVWWGMFWWSSLTQWSFFQFLFIVSYAILLFLGAGMLYPWTVPDDFDFEHHYFHNRRWFFGILFVVWLVDIPETLFKAGIGLRGAPGMYLLFVVFMLTSCAVCATSRRRSVHAIMAPLWLIVLVSYLGITTLAQIAG
jgi:hypothetical protein